MRDFSDLSEREVLALAIANEEEDGRIYSDYANALREDYPASAKVFEEMADEENEHRRRLIDLFVAKFGDHIPLVRRQDIRGKSSAAPIWHMQAAADRKGARRTRARWSRTPRASTASPPRGPPTPASASCSAISPSPRTSMTAKRRGSKTSF